VGSAYHAMEGQRAHSGGVRLGDRGQSAQPDVLASCRLCGVEPWSYLRDIFCLPPRWPEHRLLDLAPIAWSKTRERDDVRALLDQNQFRKLTLDARG
jgi:transposase